MRMRAWSISLPNSALILRIPNASENLVALSLLLAVAQNLGNNLSQDASFVQRALFDFARVSDPLHNKNVFLKFTFVRQKKAIAVVDLRKSDLLRLKVHLWLDNARYYFLILIDSVRLP